MKPSKEVIVVETLSAAMIDAGKALVERLDLANSKIKTALWLHDLDSRRWQLILSSPLIESEGPQAFYRRVQEANKQAERERDAWIIPSQHVRALQGYQALIQGLRSALQTGPGLVGIRFSRNHIDGAYIDDAYIYRSNADPIE